jgi:hypothetical protein
MIIAISSVSTIQCSDGIKGMKSYEREPERNALGHTHLHFKRSKGVKLNGILECKILANNAHRAPYMGDASTFPSLMNTMLAMHSRGERLGVRLCSA